MKGPKLTRYRIKTENTGKKPDRPFTAILLSDLHNQLYGEGHSLLLQEIRAQDPELILIAGDMVTTGSECLMDNALSLMDALTSRYPVYCVNGNHEQRLKTRRNRFGDLYETYAGRVRSMGVHLLENACETVTVRKMNLNIWGLELPDACYARGKKPVLTADDVTELLGPCDKKGFHILLAHHPGLFPAYAGWGADLILAGHYHGGIVRIPSIGGVISPQLRLFPKYSKGMFQLGEKRMIVSAGAGNHDITLRINNPAEIVAIDFL